MKLTLLLLLTVLTLFSEIVEIDNNKLQSLLLSNEKVYLIDIRTKREWQEEGIIDGSILLTYYYETGEINYRFIQSLEEMGIDIDSKVILLCEKGNRSSEVAKFLESYGFEVVYNVTLGVKDLITKGRRVNKNFY